MLRLILQGRDIPVSRDFSMRLTWKSPATDFEKIPGSYGLGLSFPITEYTRAIFGNPERYSKFRQSNDQKFNGFEVRFSGVLLMAGTLNVTSFSGGNYEASLTDEIGVLGENERERDILTFTPFTSNIPWINSSNFNPDVHPYCCFPVINPGFFKEKGATVKMPAIDTEYKQTDSYDTEALTYAFRNIPTMGRVNALNEDGSVKCIATTFEVSIPELLPAISVVSPFFFLKNIIKDSLKAVGWYIKQNAIEGNNNLKNLCIYNNFDLTINDPVTTNVTIIGTLPDGENNDEMVFEPYQSGYTITQYQRRYHAAFKPKDFLPKMSLGNLLLSTQNLLNVCFHFLYDNTVNVYSREALITSLATDLNDYFLGVWEIGEKKDLALKFTHENDVNDLVFNERFQDIEDRRADIKDPVADYNALMAIADPELGEIRYMQSSNNWMEFKMITIDVDGKTKDVMGWDEYSVGFQNGWFNRGKREEEEIKTSWSTCWGNSQYTIVSQMGNMNEWKSKFQAFSPRLLIYKGNNQGGNESANFSLDYEKAGKGIIPTCWKYWAPFWANRLPVTGRFDLPVNVLRHLIYNICSKYRTREGEFMIEEMSCDIYVDRIGETEIKGFKVE